MPISKPKKRRKTQDIQGELILYSRDGLSTVLNLIVEIKGYRGEDAKEKVNTIRTYWVPGVNNLGSFSRWPFAEFTAVFEIPAEFNKLIARLVDTTSNHAQV